MIIAKNKEASEKSFLKLLEDSKSSIKSNFIKNNKLKSVMTPDDFETYVFERMCENAENTEFKGKIEKTANAAFPDIVANHYFGAEVKMTAGDKWDSIGNSVLESSRIEGVERIYLFFGKFGGTFDIIYRNYSECLFGVAVTHYPRYKINMTLPKGESIFDKIKINYDIFRKDPGAVKKIKEYYRSLLKEGEELWWIDQQDAVANLVIRPFNEFTEEEKTKFIIESMILFPEIFGSSSLKFERVASYLVVNYGSVSSNIRDIFTAGGQQNMRMGRRTIMVPKILYHLKEHAKGIKSVLKTIDSSKLSYYWRTDRIMTNRLKQWLDLVDKRNEFGDCAASDMFNAGL